MKTIDAVNEFKGEWPDYRVGCLHYSNRLVSWAPSVHTYMNHGYQLVCISEQFNTLIQECMTNFGSSVTYDEYKDSCKARLESPLDDSHQAKVNNIGNVLHNMSCSMDDENEQNEFGNYACYLWDLASYFRNKTCYSVPQPKESNIKPVFTQAMSDNGELPPIGSKAQFAGNDDYLVEFSIADGDDIECICHTTDFEGESIGVYRHKDGYSVSILTQLIKPLDTRTDKQKAISEILSYDHTQTFEGLLSDAYDKWVGK